MESYRFPSAKKILTSSINDQAVMIFAYDHQWVVMTYRVPCGRCAFMQKLCRKVHKNWPQLLVAGPLILHDNACLHAMDVVTKKLRDYGWEVLPHAPYSADISVAHGWATNYPWQCSPAIADVVTKKLRDYGWEVLPHAPYSPDMSTLDFDLFPKLKEPMRGWLFLLWKSFLPTLPKLFDTWIKVVAFME